MTQNQNNLPPQTAISHSEMSPSDQLHVTVESLAAQPGYVAEEVTLDTISFVPEKPLVKGTENVDLGVGQDLYGVIRAGGDMFGIVGVLVVDPQSVGARHGYMLTHFEKNGGRASIVGNLDEGNPLTIGRHHQADLSEETSREHFKIGLFDGKIVVGEVGNGTANGTELIRARGTSETTAPQDEKKWGLRAIKRLSQRRTVEGQNTNLEKNPLVDFKLWSPTSQSAKDVLLNKGAVTGEINEAAEPAEVVSSKDSNRIFPDIYHAPTDQLGFEMDLRNKYAAEHPDAVEVLNDALGDIQRYAGIGIPKYEFPDEQKQAAIEAGAADELGFLPVGDNSKGFSVVQIAPRQILSKEAYTNLTEIEQGIAHMKETGSTLPGELPAATRVLIDGLYELTGASLVRDQRAEGQSQGHNIRKGIYQGSDIYFEEMYDDTQGLFGEPTFTLAILGREFAATQIEAMNKSQIKEFVEISGVSLYDVIDISIKNKITRHNYKEIAHVLQATRHIIDDAAK